MPDNILGAWVYKNEQASMVSAHARNVVGMRWWIQHFWLHKDQFGVTESSGASLLAFWLSLCPCHLLQPSQSYLEATCIQEVAWAGLAN